MIISMEREWKPEEIEQLVGLEKAASDDDTMVETARKMLDELSLSAVYALQYLALNSSDERIRLAAAKDILDRTVGRATITGSGNEAVDPMERFLKKVMKEN
jgi:hypothetical protein